MFNCPCDFADTLQGREALFPAEMRVAVAVPRGLLPGHRSPLCPCVAVRKQGAEPRFLPVQAWTVATVPAVIDTRLSEPCLATAAGCLQDLSWTEGRHQGHRDDWCQRSTRLTFPLRSWTCLRLDPAGLYCKDPFPRTCSVARDVLCGAAMHQD